MPLPYVRFSSRRVDWSHVTIRLGSVPHGFRRFSGVVLIDERDVGYLVGGEVREFRMAPGTHKLSIYLGRIACVAGFPGRKVDSQEFVVRSGERVALVCRVKRPVAERWKRLEAATVRWFFLWWAGTITAAALGWLISPALRELIAESVLRFHLEGPMVSWLYSTVHDRSATAAMAILLCVLSGAIILTVSTHRNARQLWLESGSPYEIVTEALEQGILRSRGHRVGAADLAAASGGEFAAPRDFR